LAELSSARGKLTLEKWKSLEKQTAFALRQAETGTKVKELVRQLEEECRKAEAMVGDSGL